MAMAMLTGEGPRIGQDSLDLTTDDVVEQLEIFLDEATNLANVWFGKTVAAENPALIVQMATAMLQREGAELIAISNRDKEAK